MSGRPRKSRSSRSPGVSSTGQVRLRRSGLCRTPRPTAPASRSWAVDGPPPVSWRPPPAGSPAGRSTRRSTRWPRTRGAWRSRTRTFALSAEARIVAALALSLGVGLIATPVAIRTAERIGFYDRPLGYKGHAAPTPYLGGAAVVVGFLVGALGIVGDLSRLAPIFVCALVLFVVGTLDDRVGLGAGPRVAVETGAAVALFVAGLGWHAFGSDAANLALTIAWVVGVVNAFNLMDNMDGAAGTVAVLSSIGAAVLALSVDDHAVAALSIALCGACLGFLPFNLSAPARIFLGDGGSMPIGFVVSAAIMAVPLHGTVGWHRLLVAALLVSPVVVDTTLVMVSRRRAGVAVAMGGRDHLTHRLRMRFHSARTVALVLASAQAAACATALVIADLGDAATAVAWALLIVCVAALVALFETRA